MVGARRLHWWQKHSAANHRYATNIIASYLHQFAHKRSAWAGGYGTAPPVVSKARAGNIPYLPGFEKAYLKAMGQQTA